MKIRLDFILLGAVALIAGIKMCRTGYVWSAPITPMAAIIVCVFGVVAIVWGLLARKTNSKEEGLMTCEKCNAKYKASDTNSTICPKCNGKTKGSNKT